MRQKRNEKTTTAAIQISSQKRHVVKVDEEIQLVSKYTVSTKCNNKQTVTYRHKYI